MSAAAMGSSGVGRPQKSEHATDCVDVAVDPGTVYPAALPPVFDAMAHAAAAGRSGYLSGSDGREKWITRQLAANEAAYCAMQPASAVCVTFNVGCYKPPPTLAFILGAGVRGPRDAAAPELVVVGLQEVDMSATALMREETDAAVPWLQAVIRELEINKESPPYRLVAQRQLVGLMLIVCVRSTAAHLVSNCHVSTIATGALGTVANKGAIGFRCTYRLSTLCFVVCHLAAHQNAVAKRNQDIAQILAGLNLSPPPTTTNTTTVANSAGGTTIMEASPTAAAVAAAQTLLPQDHDVCIVLGDLNYRINLSYEAACDAAQRQDIKALLRDDQLVRELTQVHTPWRGFTEFTPTFLPTYRFDVGTDQYDTSEKKRIPSFTDRILYCGRDRAHSAVELVSLESVMSIRSSDHKPVVARVNIPVKEADPRKRRDVESAIRQLVEEHGLDKCSTASLQASWQHADFGTVDYLHAKSYELELVNTGLCVADVRLTRRANDDFSDASWLRVQPAALQILPGQSAKVTVSAVADWLSLRCFAAEMPFQGRAGVPLNGFVMVTVRDGPAKVLDCKCTVAVGCMGNTLDNISRVGNNFTVAQAYQARRDQDPGRPTRPSVPKELWFLVDALACGGAANAADLFDDSAVDPAHLRKIIQWLDERPEPIDRAALGVSLPSIATCLALFLRDLQLAVIPPTHHAAAIQAGKVNSPAAVMTVLRSLPTQHHNVLVYLVSFGRFLLKPEHVANTGLTHTYLATLWAPVIFALTPHARPRTEGGGGASSSSAVGGSGGGGGPSSGGGGALGGDGGSALSADEASRAGRDANTALSLRKSSEAELEAAVRFLCILLEGRPELVA